MVPFLRRISSQRLPEHLSSDSCRVFTRPAAEYARFIRNFFSDSEQPRPLANLLLLSREQLVAVYEGLSSVFYRIRKSGLEFDIEIAVSVVSGVL